MKKSQLHLLRLFLIFLALQTFVSYARGGIKEWTFIVYMAADNNLYYFARQNLEAMKNVGSNDKINILVQLDHRGETKTPERLHIEKGKIHRWESDNISLTEKLDFGQVDTLVDCMRWATTEYPAHHYALVLWNHGIGAVDSIIGKTVNSSELFIFNPAKTLLELNRNVEFLEYFGKENPDNRGICFSDTYSTYITNHKLEIALERISKEVLQGKKLDILAFDACLMGMVEIASLAAPYSDIMVGSQEVELGTGWPYERILKKLAHHSLSPHEFAQHIVTSYSDYYYNITKDYTQSALDLAYINELETNILRFTSFIIPYLKNPSYELLNKFIKTCKSKKLCTYFSEPSYIDFYHFYSNLIEGINVIKSDPGFTPEFIHTLEQLLHAGLESIQKIVIKNGVGKNLEKAHGISIYFPNSKLHSSYLTIPFGLKTGWLTFLHSII